MKKDLEAAANWIKSTTGSDKYTISPLRQEASSRSYYRIITDELSYILAVQSKEAAEKNSAAFWADKLNENDFIKKIQLF